MNKWVLLYILFAPCFASVMFLWFNRAWLVRKWWFYRHPQTVYKVTHFYPNKMYSERFVSTLKESFEFEGGTYHIKKSAIIRKNWAGIVPSNEVLINAQNCLHFEHYKVYHKERFADVPDKATLVGELHYIFDIPEPIDYTKNEGLTLYRTAIEENRIEKNSVLDQLITAEFKKTTLMIIIILLVLIILVTGLLLALRFEILKVPLHAVCVNAGG